MAPPVTKEMAAKVAKTKNPWAYEATLKDIELLKLEKQRREEEGYVDGLRRRILSSNLKHNGCTCR